MKFSATVLLFALLTSSTKADESQEYESIYGAGTRAIESFSSANGGFSGYNDSPIYAIECYNGWCSDKVIWYSADLTEDLDRDLETNTPFFSEEGSARQDCPAGTIVSRIQCTGDRCDNMSLYCSPFKSDSPFEVSTTDFANQNSFSEEQNGLDPQYTCPESYYVSGIGCSGEWCDNISFRCAKVTYSCPNRPNLANLALHRPTSQSSTWPNEWNGMYLTSDKAVDGEFFGMQHTNGGGSPNWWRVELEDGASVDQVTVYKRGDCCDDRYYGFYVALKKNGVVVAEYYQESNFDGDSLDISFCGEAADEVEIRNDGTGNNLQFGEVEVMGLVYSEIEVYSTGSFGLNTPGKEYFNEVFQGATSTGIIRRQCPDCADTHQDIYFKRKTSPSTFDAYEYMMVTWSDTNNVMHQDFDIYSTLDDAFAEVNAWIFCNYDDNGIGFPRDCGPNGYVSWQWNSLTHSGTRQNYRYAVITTGSVEAYVCTANAWGDPHLTTFDGLKFDAQPKGEAIFFMQDNSPFQMQAQLTQALSNDPLPAVTTGVAIHGNSMNQPSIQVSMATERTTFGQRENGYCVMSNGADQNNGVIRLEGGDFVDEIGQQDTEKVNRCLDMCASYEGATGCEMIWDQWNRGCYVHTDSIARGNNAIRHSCYVATGTTGAPTQVIYTDDGYECPVELLVDCTLLRSLSYDLDVIVESDGNEITVEYPGLLSVHLTVSHYGTCYFSMDVNLLDCGSAKDTVRGLLGSPNDDPYDDWMDRNGNPYAIPSGASAYFFEPAFDYVKENWMVTDEADSLFCHVSRDFEFPNEPYDPEIEERTRNPPDPCVVEICGDDIGCRIDGVTLGCGAARQFTIDSPEPRDFELVFDDELCEEEL